MSRIRAALRRDACDFLRQYCAQSRMRAFDTARVSPGIPAVTIKIPRMESVHENRTGRKTSIIAASIGERFHPITGCTTAHNTQHIDLYRKDSTQPQSN
ncbi:hypothetical protein [Burkholderia latens]|uniref:hypothetical protein n=1 Tax=Burkholderia latens TaxID=488446 RepID=UPI00158EB80D|nr:hypothetical protein [Burkholderia latens]